LLDIWLATCARLGIEEVLINTHHLAEQVESWARRQRSGVKVRLFHEDVLLGSAGTVAANREFVRDAGDFYVFYADNLVDIDFRSLRTFHQSHDGVLTMALFRSSAPRECGIVCLDEEGCVVGFEEKPSQPPSDLAFAGILLARQTLFDCLPAGRFADFGRDVFPLLVGRMWGIPIKGYLRDIGTMENYRKALEEWPLVSGLWASADSQHTGGLAGHRAQ